MAWNYYQTTENPENEAFVAASRRLRRRPG
jgi:hypothetical protein